MRSVDLDTEALVVKGRVQCEQDRFLQVYFNERTGTTGFSLVENEQRIWGIDSDDLRGWHVHPADQPDQHRDLEAMTLEKIVGALEEAWDRLP